MDLVLQGNIVCKVHLPEQTVLMELICLLLEPDLLMIVYQFLLDYIQLELE